MARLACVTVPATHRGLAEMYVGDDRFMRNYDDRAPVLAQYVRDAIVALSPEA